MIATASSPAASADYLRACAPAWAKVSLSGVELKVLVLVVAKAGVTNKHLQAVTGMLPATISRVVGRLAADGLVEKCEDYRDRRLVLCRPTSAGRSLIHSLLPRP